MIDLAGAFAGWATAVTGDPAAGVDALWAAMEGLRSAGFAMLRSWHLELLAGSLLAGGRLEEAQRMASEAIDVAERTGTTFHLASHHLTHALVLASAGAVEDADRSLATAARIAAAQRSPTLQARVTAATLRP